MCSNEIFLDVNEPSLDHLLETEYIFDVSCLDTADLASTVLVFGVTALLAFVSPYAAMWCWVALIPAKFLIGRLYRRARTPSGGQTE